MMATILAVFAHPDDETFICGGTLAKYAYDGHRVVLVCATKGEMGRRMGVPPIATRESIPKLREQELINACKALHIEDLRFLGIRDKLLEIHPFESLTQTVLEQMIDVKPDVVITFHETLGGHPDHCTIGLATKSAFARYANTNLEAELYYVCWSNVAQDPKFYGFLPEQITEINVKNEHLHKLQAYRAHKTQSEMDAWVWKSVQESVSHFQSHEYFIKVHEPFISNKQSLI
jgi:bacillithiol biosynthesis deacetylase BshB2